MSKPSDGFKLSNATAVPLKAGDYAYWDAHLQNIVREHLAASHPAVKVERGDDDNWNTFSAAFRLDVGGRELCASSTSLENPKASIPAADVDVLTTSLDKFHKLADNPNATNLAKAFIRGYRVPDPRKMRSAWRVSTNGPVKRLLLLWGWYPKGGLADTVLPLTPTSRNWEDADRRVDLKEALQEADRLTFSRFDWAWIFTRIFLGLLLAALLGLLGFLGCNVLKPRYCDVHPASQLVRGDGLIPSVCTNTCDFVYDDGSVCGQHLDADNRCPKSCTFVYDDGTVCGAHLDLSGACPNICSVTLDSGVPCGTHLASDGSCPNAANHPSVPLTLVCDICGTPLDDFGLCPNACTFTFDDGTVCGQHADSDGKFPCHCTALLEDDAVCDTHLAADGLTCPNAGKHKKEPGEEPVPEQNECLDHPGTALIDGFCPVRCPEPLKSGASSHGHPNSNWRGWAPHRAPNACGAHLNPDYSCPNAQNHVDTTVHWCLDHPDTALVKGKCHWTCPETLKKGGICRAHLNPDYSCPNAQNHEDTAVYRCSDHPDTALVKGICPKRCKVRLESGEICNAHLNADLSCPNAGNHPATALPLLPTDEFCSDHPQSRLVNGQCTNVCAFVHEDGSVCNTHLDASGRCPNLCTYLLKSGGICNTHHRQDDSCPNAVNHRKVKFCPIHPDAPLGDDDRCPNVCKFAYEDGSLCDTHLLANGLCRRLCPVFLGNGRVCATHLRRDGSCPNAQNHPSEDPPTPPSGEFCSIHPETRLVDGFCTVRCTNELDAGGTCFTHLDADLSCPNAENHARACEIHPSCWLRNGRCPMVCSFDLGNGETCGRHLEADGTCPLHDVLYHCPVHNLDITPIGNQKCPRRCSVDRGDGQPCDRHLDADMKCPLHGAKDCDDCKVCPVHGTEYNIYGRCPLFCDKLLSSGDPCNTHLNADLSCPNADNHATNADNHAKGKISITVTNKPLDVLPGSGGNTPGTEEKDVFCRIHPGSALVDGKCPEVCSIHTNTHLDANLNCPLCLPKPVEHCPDHPDTLLENGNCPKICDIHKTHLDKNGNCPRCGTPPPPPRPDCSIVVNNADPDPDGAFHPVFSFHVHDTAATVSSLRWFLDGSLAANETGASFTPSFPDDSPHTVSANAEWVLDGARGKGSASVEWDPNLPEALIYRDIVQIEKRKTDDETIFVFGVKSKEDNGKASVANWTLFREGRPIEADTEGQHILVHGGRDIGGEANMTIGADIQVEGKNVRKLEKTYRFSYDPFAVSSSLGDKEANHVEKAVQDKISSVYWISVPGFRGTAFAITPKRLLTNYHVVEPLPEGEKAKLYQANSGNALDGVVIASDPLRDLALVEILDKNVRLEPIRPAMGKPAPGQAIACIGYPWSSQASDEVEGNHEPTVTAGTITAIEDDPSRGPIIKADALVMQGNSGGPAIDSDGRLVGVVSLLPLQPGPKGEAINDGVGIIPLAEVRSFLAKHK